MFIGSMNLKIRDKYVCPAIMITQRLIFIALSEFLHRDYCLKQDPDRDFKIDRGKLRISISTIHEVS